MGELKKPSPLEFSKLAWNQKTYYLSCWYLDRCTEEELFTNNRPSKALGQVRGYLINKVDPKELLCLYEAVYSLEDKCIMGIFDIWLLSEKVRLQQRMNTGKPNEDIVPYESLLDCMKGM